MKNASDRLLGDNFSKRSLYVLGPWQTRNKAMLYCSHIHILLHVILTLESFSEARKIKAPHDCLVTLPFTML